MERNTENYTVKVVLASDPKPDKAEGRCQTAQYISDIMFDIKEDCRRLASMMEDNLALFVERNFLTLHTKSHLLSELELLLSRIDNIKGRENILNEIDETMEDALDRMIEVGQRYPSTNSPMRNLIQQALDQRWSLLYQICTKVRKYAERHEPSDPCTQMSNGR